MVPTVFSRYDKNVYCTINPVTFTIIKMQILSKKSLGNIQVNIVSKAVERRKNHVNDLVDLIHK
jgi:hypothetical protein